MERGNGNVMEPVRAEKKKKMRGKERKELTRKTYYNSKGLEA